MIDRLLKVVATLRFYVLTQQIFIFLVAHQWFCLLGKVSDAKFMKTVLTAK